MADKEQARASKFMKHPGHNTLMGKQDMNTVLDNKALHDANNMGAK